MSSELTIYKVDKKTPTNMKYHVFISKETTTQLATIIEEEDWGQNAAVLYKYLDYIWRAQLYDKMVKQFIYKNEPRLVFNTGLFFKNTNNILYLLLIPNNGYSKNSPTQQWRVAFGLQNNESFINKNDLINLYKFNINDIPIKTNFLKNCNNDKFDASYSVKINLYERIRTGKPRIMQTIKNDSGYTKNINSKLLYEMLNNSINESLKEAQNNVDFVGKQVFFLKRGHGGYHIEYLLPLTLDIYGKNVYFALALRKHKTRKEYIGMSIVKREMAYSNSRLIGKVTIPWLKPFANSNKMADKKDLKPLKLTNTELLTNLTNQAWIQYTKSNKIETNPFIYLATILPLKLPELNIPKTEKKKN